MHDAAVPATDMLTQAEIDRCLTAFQGLDPQRNGFINKWDLQRFFEGTCITPVLSVSSMGACDEVKGTLSGISSACCGTALGHRVRASDVQDMFTYLDGSTNGTVGTFLCTRGSVCSPSTLFVYYVAMLLCNAQLPTRCVPVCVRGCGYRLCRLYQADRTAQTQHSRRQRTRYVYDKLHETRNTR